MDDLLQEFIAETRETLEALAGEIVAWEADPADRARLDAIFRFVHTVKGSCGFLDLPRLARLSHAAEDVLAAVRAGERAADKPLVDAVLAIVDRIGEIVDAIDVGVALDDAGEDQLLDALRRDAALPTPATVPAPAAATAPRTPTRSVRLSVDLLDRMMGGMSDMVLARNELARRLRDNAADPASEAALERLSSTVADMREIVTRTRMQRIDALFSTLPRLVRDTAATAGKAVDLVIDGEDVELDREMIEMMRDPLTHMIRNAIDHGIEAPTERRRVGKREGGRLVVAARQSGNRIIVEVSDDGRGIDTARLAAKVSAAQPARAEAVRAMSPAALADLVFEPGLSTRDVADELSGRGVGMDVVRANIEQLGGGVALRNAPGRGLRVLIEVPLTLAIISAVTVVAGGQRFAVARSAIDEFVALTAPTLRLDTLGEATVATLRDRRLPLVDLGATLALGAVSSTGLLMIVNVAGGSYAMAVDAVEDTEELVVKPAAPAVMATGYYAGQVLPDSGLPMLLVDCAGIAQSVGIAFDRAGIGDEAEVEAVEPQPEVLLFDDLDGVRRALALAAIDRVERVDVARIGESGGRLRATLDGRLLPLVARGALPTKGIVSVLRIDDGTVALGYVVADVDDIVRLPEEIALAAGDDSVGVTLIGGAPVELIDPLWLLAQAEATVAPSGRLCLLAGADRAWLQRFVRPSLEEGGYRVVETLDTAAVPAVILAMDGETIEPAGDARIVRLSRRRDDGGIWRYDRTAVLAAVAGDRA